jgi:hypothetical protein
LISLHVYIRDWDARKALGQEMRLTWGRMNSSASMSTSETDAQGMLLFKK